MLKSAFLLNTMSEEATFSFTLYLNCNRVSLFPRVWNGDGVTGDGGDGEVTGDKIFTGDKIVTGEAFSPVKLVLKRDRRAVWTFSIGLI